MTEDGLVEALRTRAANPELRTSISSRRSRAQPLPAPATEAQLHDTEAALAFTLPELLRRLFLEVANGGFGPGYGTWGAIGGYSDPDDGCLVDIYRQFREAHDPWPAGLLPLWTWGGGIFSCLDTTTEAGRILTADEHALTETSYDLTTWFEGWATLPDFFETFYSVTEVSGTNPFTKKPATMRVPGRAKGRILRRHS